MEINKIYQFLLIALAFLLPLTVFGANLIIVIICLIWLFSGNYKAKYLHIVSNKLMIASIVFYSMHILGMFWTEDILWGLEILHKMWYFILLFPVLFNIVKNSHVKYYISAFLLAISLTEIVSYLVWFEIIPPFKNATVENPTPFMSHISYNPILAFSIYLVSHQIFFNKNLTRIQSIIYIVFVTSMSINMFITGGRAGHVAFFLVISILIFQIFDKNRIKAFFLSVFSALIIFILAYYTSDFFQLRVNMAVESILNFSENQNTSLGQRIVFTMNSWEIIRENLFFGVGTGDFMIEYKKINEINTPHLTNASNPHNMYVLILTQLGLFGLIGMLSIFYFQIKLSLKETNKYFRDVGFTLPLLFLVIMLSDSYLLGHYTTLLFVFFSSFLYQKFE